MRAGARPVDAPLTHCTRCSSSAVATVKDSVGTGVYVRCADCGHVLSLVALRGVAARVGSEPPEVVADQLRILAGAPPRHRLHLAAVGGRS